jgi:integrase
MTAIKLTQKIVDAECWSGKTRFVRDEKITGLMLSVNKNSKTWKVQRDMWHQKRCLTIRHTLGSSDQMKLDEARAKAQEVLSKIAQGVNPNKNEDENQRKVWTIEQLWDEYEADMRQRELADGSIASFRIHLENYLRDWRKRPMTEIRKSMCREKHRLITTRHGPYSANQAMRSLRAAWNFALKVFDDPDSLPNNPVSAVTFHRERRREAVILPEDLPGWWTKTGELSNPLRRQMHRLGLLSGLRPGTLVSIERDWIQLEGKAIILPRMKSGREFHLPLSEPMAEIVESALIISHALYPNARWLFPSRSNDGKRTISTQVWKEKALPSETGHILRHTYRTLAHAAGVAETDGRLLLDQKVQGMSGVYIHERALFDHLFEQQARVSSHILKLANSSLRLPPPN